MSTQGIKDYLNKQIFIEKNIVTYRSLSRHLGIHVNAAKNELATYHHYAPYHSQTCVATFLLSGIPRSDTRRKASQSSDEDFNMDSTQGTRDDSDDGDEVPQTSITIVNEKDLEDAKLAYDELNTIHVYSLSPAPLIDAGLLCGPTECVRSTDKTKGAEFVTSFGRIIDAGIKVGAVKKKVQAPAPVAGPSKSKPDAIPEPKVVKPEPKEKPSATSDKSKPTGKLNFFKKPEKPKDAPETKKIKQEEPAPETAKRMFFSKPPAKVSTMPLESKKSPSVKAPSSKAASPAPSVASTKDENEPPSRGVKRKSSVGLGVREASPANPATVSEGKTQRRRVVLSSDEEDEVPVKSSRRSKLSHKIESADDSSTGGDARLLMDIDDDEVEKASRVPSTNASSNEHDDDDLDDNEGSTVMDEDVHMTDDASSKPKVVKKRKPKQVIPIGKNGLKKRKVTKTRRTKDANGYIVREDYSDWESVPSDAEPEPPAPAKGKKQPTVVKKEEETLEVPPPVKEDKAPLKSKAPSKATPATKSKTAPKPKTQKAMMTNFFKRST